MWTSAWLMHDLDYYCNTVYFLLQVFTVDVWVSGRHHMIERRYSEFEDLHKQVSYCMWMGGLLPELECKLSYSQSQVQSLS